MSKQEVAETTQLDGRYMHARCDNCTGVYQLIDWGCALHRVMCDSVDRPEVKELLDY